MERCVDEYEMRERLRRQKKSLIQILRPKPIVTDLDGDGFNGMYNPREVLCVEYELHACAWCTSSFSFFCKSHVQIQADFGLDFKHRQYLQACLII